MKTISADERERMLFKAGLASDTILKREQRLNNRRAWANRKVSDHVTKLSNIQPLLRDNPPISPLIKNYDQGDINFEFTAGLLERDKNVSMSPLASERPRTQGVANRKSLLL